MNYSKLKTVMNDKGQDIVGGWNGYSDLIYLKLVRIQAVIFPIINMDSTLLYSSDIFKVNIYIFLHLYS